MTKPDPMPTIDLSAQIEDEHKAALGCAQSAIEHAIRCGEPLIQAKAEAGHGGWLAGVAANLTISVRQCQKYMRWRSTRPTCQTRIRNSHIH